LAKICVATTARDALPADPQSNFGFVRSVSLRSIASLPKNAYRLQVEAVFGRTVTCFADAGRAARCIGASMGRSVDRQTLSSA